MARIFTFATALGVILIALAPVIYAYVALL